MVCSVENVVGRNLYEPSATALNSLCQQFGCLGIELLAQSHALLCLVYGSEGGTVDDAINLIVGHEAVYRLAVGDVKFSHIGVEELVFGVSGLEQTQLAAQLAVAASNQYVHTLR